MNTPTSNYPRPHLEERTGPPDGPPCPQCANPYSKKVNFTWWGGVVGPRMFSLRRCEACRCQYNGRTGQCAKKAIILYNVVAALLTILAVIATAIAVSSYD